MLISLLLPALNKARQSSETLKCMTNMRQLGIGMIQYGADNQGYITPAEASWNSDITWDDSIRYYVGRGFDSSYTTIGALATDLAWRNPPVSDDIIQCPADFATRPRQQSFRFRSYSMVGRAGDPAGTPLDRAWGPVNNSGFTIKFTQLRDPSHTALLVENWNGGNLASYTGGALITNTSGQWNNGMKGGHPAQSFKFNYLAADGHVETLHQNEPAARAQPT